jgi:hypothetical protein
MVIKKEMDKLTASSPVLTASSAALTVSSTNKIKARMREVVPGTTAVELDPPPDNLSNFKKEIEERMES